jgi:hypothetical protein
LNPTADMSFCRASQIAPVDLLINSAPPTLALVLKRSVLSCTKANFTLTILRRSDPSSSSHNALLARTTTMPFSNLDSLGLQLRAGDDNTYNAV